jgi:drug/metabolite transporter (DMT)-like permease
MLTNIRNFLKGKKVYLTAAVGIVGVLIAWGDGSLTNMQALGMLWAAAQTIFLKAGVGNSVADALNKLVPDETPSLPPKV